MKKFIVTIILCIMAVGLSACLASDNAPQSEQGQSQTTAPSKSNSNENTVKAALEPLDNKQKTIVVSVLSATDFYKLAKEKYEKLHPNTTIQLKEFEGSSSNGLMSKSEVEKYVKQTTTEILSGKGADLFAFTVINELPIDKYINKKAFVNLDEWMQIDSSFDPNKYQMNIIEGSKLNGASYILPLEYYLEAYYGDAEAFKNAGVTIDDKSWTWSDFADISKQLKAKNNERYAMGNFAPERMINNLVSDNYSRLIDGAGGKASFDSPIFMDMLKQAKALYDDKILKSDYVDMKNSSFTYSRITSPSDYLVRLGLYYPNGKVYQKPHSSGQRSGVSFEPTNQIAMNANSKVQRDAWEFVKFLLSEEIQSNPRQSGFSMIKAINDKAIEDLKSKEVLQNTKGGNIKIKAQDLEPIRELLSAPSVRSMGDESTVQKIIAEETKAFFSGQKTAEAVAKLIQNRVVTYLNE
ncbi:ABC transporter substrate-binding protein [Paenibacillus oceani]|uniref:Carbohydrate ABC transporter substrate-binding protein n=1 Tax=Paenibacillus oceani TaxID=2772510 RepID=A0A927H068_9BACL|nr:ABC transporter substrate-binding protein [Paenibacillus oceani]MBD2862832.1 carbohydrate ABC transporter substrate-binding protein [Paenibacillus oceani]